MRFTRAQITRALRMQKAAVFSELRKQKAEVTSELREVKRRVFKRKASKPIIAGIALATVGLTASIAFALAVDPGANSKIDYSMTFNGTDTYLTSSQQVVPATGDFTVEAYAKFTADGSNRHNFIWSTGTNGGAVSGQFGIALTTMWANNNDAVCVEIVDNSTTPTCISPRMFFSPDDWVHVGVTYTQSTGKYALYLNGVSIYSWNRSVTTIASGFAIGRSAIAVNNGNFMTQSTYFKGGIDEVKVFNTVRSQANIAADAYTYLPTNTTGLVADYDFNEGGTGAGSIFDRTGSNYDLTVSGTAAFEDIAQMVTSPTTRGGTTVIKFTRSYLTAGGGWTPQGGVGVVAGKAYGGGGGGGGGSSDQAITNNSGGGGGAAGAITNISTFVSSSVTVKVGLGGAGGAGTVVSAPTAMPQQGATGGTTYFTATSAVGGQGGFGAGYSSGTATFTAGLGGKGGGSGTGSTITTLADGGGGGGNVAAASDSRTGGAGLADPTLGGMYRVGGSGGLAQNSTGNDTFQPAATGSGGCGGLGRNGQFDGGMGCLGVTGAIIFSYNAYATQQDQDYLYTFNGTTQYADIPASSTALNLTGNFTLQAWVNPTNKCLSAYCAIAGRENNYVLGTSNGTYRWQVATSSGAVAWYDSGVPAVVGQWQHVALVRNGAIVQVYLNGQLASTQTDGDVDASGVTIATTSTSATTTGRFVVAARGLNHEDYFAGGIDEVRVWSAARTAAEIGDPSTGDFNRALNSTELGSTNLTAYWDFNEAAATGYWANRKTGALQNTDLTYYGAPTSYTNGSSTTINNRYLTLVSASSQTYYAPDSTSLELPGTNFAISAWVMAPGCSGTKYLVTKDSTYSMALDSSCKVNFALDPGNEGDATTWQWMNTGYAVPAATWQYLSLIKVGTTAYLYANGALVSTIANGDTVPNLNNAGTVTALIPANLGDRNTYFGLGSTGSGSTRANFSAIYIDDVRLFSTDRRARQSLDMAGFVPHTTTGLKALFDFNTVNTSGYTAFNTASGADTTSNLTAAGTVLTNIFSTTSAPPNQPVFSQQIVRRSIIKSSAIAGTIPTAGTSAEYWIAGGGGGGGSGGNTGYSGGGGGAGALAEGTMTGLTTGSTSEPVTTIKIGVGGRHAQNNGDSVTQTATNGYATSFATTGVSISAAGGGAGGSGTTNPASAPQGAAGGSGGGSGQTGGSGGAATAGNAGGAGSSAAAGGGGGYNSAGSAALAGAGGAGGKGALIPLGADSLNQPVWGVGGGTGFGSTSAVNSNSAYGATAAGADASGYGSGGGGNGFASAGTGVARGGVGGAGIAVINYMQTQPFVDSAPTQLQSGYLSDTPFVVSLRDINGNIMNQNYAVTVTVYNNNGCSNAGTTNSVTSVNGVATFKAIMVKSTSASTSTTCLIGFSDSVSGRLTTLTVPMRTSPASITLGGDATTTTSTCAFVSGFFNCPDATVATLKYSDLNAALDTYDAVYLSTASGAITFNGPLVTGTRGSLTLSSYTDTNLYSPIQLTGLNKGITVKTRDGGGINFQAATSSTPTVFSTNGGAVLLNPMVTASTAYSSLKVLIPAYNSWQTNGGSFTMAGGIDPTVGYIGGSSQVDGSAVVIDTGASISTGAGDITIRGRGYGDVRAGGWYRGLWLNSSSLVTTSGNITLVGNAGANHSGATNEARYGTIFSNANITTGSGNISISANTNADTTGQDYIWSLSSTGTTVTSSSGNIDINAIGYTSTAAIDFTATALNTVGSATGNVTIAANTASGLKTTAFFRQLKLTGAGTHKLAATVPSIGAGFSGEGTGDFIFTSSLGTSGYALQSVGFGSNFLLGTGYKNISLVDASAGPTFGIGVAATLTSSQSVTLIAKDIAGAGAVVSPKLAMKQVGIGGVNSYLTGASDVTTVALSREATTAATYGNTGIVDANGFTPGDVNGVTAVWGVPTKLGMFTEPATTLPRNAPLTTQPVAQVQDAWGLAPTGDSLLPGYVITPSVSTGTISPTTSVTSDSAGKAAFTGITPTAYGNQYLIFTSSPTLTSKNSATFAPAASSTIITQAATTAGSTTAVSGTAFTAQPQVTLKDAYGNTATLATTMPTPTVALTSYPAGASTASLTNTPPVAAGAAIWTGAAFKITGPTGDYTITFTFNNASTNNTAVTSTLTVTVTGWQLSYGASTLNYQPTAYAATFQGNGTGAVTYSSTTTTICTLNTSTGAITPLKSGTCTVTGTQAADGTYPSGSSTVSVTIAVAPQDTVTITATPSTITYGGSTTLSGAGGSGSGTFSYTKVSGNCSLSGATLTYGTANAGETCVVYATKGLTANQYSATNSANLTINVVKAAQVTAVTVPTGRQAGYGNAVDLSTFTYSGGTGTGAFVFSTSTPGCSITGTVLTSTAAIGSNCVVAVQRDTSTNYLISSAVNMNVQTIKGTQTVSYVTIASAVRVNGQVTLNATSTSGLTVSYALGTGSSAYCSLAGATVTFTAPGTCVINASQAGDTNYNAATVAPITYTVSKALQNITFGPLTDDVVRTTTKTVSGTIDSGLAITYSVGSNTTNSACTVTSIGVVSLNAVGTCEIVASQAGTSLYEAATSVAATFAIARGTQSPLVITSSSTTTFAHNITLAATGGNGSNSYVWSATGDCSITGGNTLIPGAVGANCVVSVDRAGDTNWFDATTATQTITIDKAAQSTLTITNPNTVVYGNQLALTYGGGSGTGAVTWSATSPCSVTGTNLTVGNAGVSCVITVTKDADDSYLAASATMTISVTRADQATLTIDSTDHVAYRGVIALSASGGSGNGAISWTTTGTCTVGAGDLLTVGNAGSPCTVTATRAASTNYNAVSSATMTITIDKADQTIGAINAPGVPRALGSVPLAATSDSGLTVAFTVDSGSTSVCSITGAMLSFTTSGTCVVNANQSGNTNFNAAPQVQRTFNVAHATQSINLVNPGQKRYQDANFAMMGSASSSLALIYSLGSNTSLDSQNASVCSVSSNGTVQIFDVGTCEILADQTGDVVYDPAPQSSVTFTIAKAFQSALSLTSADTYVYGTSLQLTATGGSGTGALTITSDAGQDCQLDPQTNVISGGGAGASCLIRITKAGDAQFESAQTGLLPITITKASQSITFTSTPVNPTAQGSYIVTASADSGDAVTFAISAQSSSVCSISGSTVTFLTGGICVINADQTGNTNYDAATRAQQMITVDKVMQNVTYTNPGNHQYGGADFQISASSDSGLQLAFSIGQTSFFGGQGQTPPAPSCSVSPTGVVTILEVGPCVIDIDQVGNDIYHPVVTIRITFFITRANQAALAMSSISSVTYGDTITLAATGGSGTGAVTYATTGTCSASNGVLTVGDAGSVCTVTATKADDDHYLSESSAAQTITINKANQALISITSTSLVTYGQTVQVVATGGSGLGAWSYSTTGTCSVDSTGLLTPGDAGSSCTVTATKAESTNYNAKSSLAQSINIFKANQSITFTSSPVNPTALGSYTVTASADSGDAVTFAISPQSNSVCSISGSTVSFLTSGSCVIDADQSGNTNYNAATRVQQTISVGKASQTIAFTSAGVKKFGDASFSAVASSTSGLTITFGLGSGTTNSACSVASDGTVTILDVGICEVTADQSGDSVYAAAARATQQITINKGVQSTLTMYSSSSVTYGQTLTLTTSGGSGAGSVSYDVSGDCTESNGVLTVGIVGSACQVRATKAADSQYLAKTSVWQTITVTKANQSTLTITSTNTVAYGDTITLAVSGGSGPTSLSYTTTGTCSVTSGVLHVGNANSSCTVTATNAASNNYEAISSAAQTVTITKAANTVHFTSAAVNPTALGTYSVTASADSGDQVSFAINSSSSSVCSVSGSTVSFLTSGDCVIDASEDGNDNFNAASTVQQTVTVAKASQTITFTPTTSKRYGSGTFSVSASSNSNLTITYSRGSGTTNTACSVASDGTVTILDVGNCQITANQGGNIVYSAATAVNQDVTIIKGTQATLTMTSASTDAYGDPLTLTAAGGSGTGTVTFAAIGDCTISNGVLTVGVVGSTCSVTATKSGDSQYDPITSAAQTITTIKGTQATLTINGNAHQTYGTTQVLSTSGGSGNGAVTYTTGAGCSAMGNILTVGGGGSTCQVRAHKAASANYNTIDSVDFFVTVDKADQTITSHSTASLPAALDLYNPSGTASSGLTVTFDVDASTSSVCSKTVNAIRFDAGGTCKVNFFQAGNANYNAAPQVQETITVAKLDQSISGPAAFTVHYGDADFQIQATVTSGLAIAYTLDAADTTNNSCTISSTGMVHIVTTGNCAWTMSQAGDAVYNPTSTGAYFVYIDRAQQASVSISVSATTGFAYGTITVSGSGGSGTGSFSYATIGTCTVSGTTVTLGAYGSQCEVYAIKARDANYADEASAATTITVARATQATLSMSSASSVAYGGTITLATTGGSGDGAVTYATTGTCSVNNGVLTVGNAGSACTVTATKAQSANYLVASSAAQTITINKADQVVAFTSNTSMWEAIHYIVPTFSSNSGLTLDVSIDPSASTVCAMSGTHVNLLTSGTCIIHANQAGNANYNPLVEITQSGYVNKTGQFITVGDVPRHYVGDQPFPLYAQSSGFNYVNWSLGSGTTNNSCTVNTSTGVVTILNTGTCEVNADNPGDISYEPALTATITFPIGKGTQTPLVIGNATPMTFGTTVNLSTTGGTVNGTITYSTTGTCSVTGSTLRVGDAGSACTVTAFLDGNNQYLPVTSATVTVVIEQATQADLTISASSANVAYGSTVTLATSGGSGTGAVTYATSGSCSITNGVLSFGAAATTCIVTPTKAQSTNYLQKVGTDYTFTVAKANQSISITSTPSSSVALDTYTFVATATSGLAVDPSIASASSTVCSVSGYTVTFLTAGSCVINADQPGDTNFNAATRVQQTITVTKKAQTITFPQVPTQQFGAAAVSLTASAQSNLQVTYAVDAATTNNSCSVDNTNQTVSLLGAGDCYLTADQAGNDTWSASAQAAMHFTITRGNQVTVSMTSGSSVVYGNTLSLTASGGSGNGSFTFAATGTCTVSGSTLTVGDAGSACSVTATKAQDTNYLAKTSAAQTITITRATQATLVLSSIASVTYGQTLTLSTTGGSGTGAVTYTASGSCTVSGNTLTGGPAGSNCVVYATKAESTNYNSIDSASRTQSVAKSAQTISLTSTPSSPTALGSYTVVTTASSGLTPVVTVDSASNTVCSVSGMVISFLTSGSCAIYVDQSGDSNYNAATQVPQTITVAKAAQTITFNQPADVAMYATAPNFGATASSGLTVSYAVTSNGTAACSITTGGALTAIAPGLCEISVSQSGNSVYSTALAVVRSFNIIRAAQSTVTITSNSSVDYLGSITLAATGGSGAGAISFTANGTCAITNGVLTVGEVGSSCAVTATKAGDTNYDAQTSATQNITVNQIAQDAIIVVSAARVRYGQTMPLVSAGGSGPGAETWSIDTTTTSNSAGCAINSSALTLSVTTSGACDVVVTKAASRNYRSEVSPRFTVTADKAFQSVTYSTGVPTQPLPGDTYTVTATSSSGLPVSFTIGGASVGLCSISGNVVTLIATGDCEIRADQAGDGRYLAAPRTNQHVHTGSLNQVITASTVTNKTFGDPSFVIVGETTSTSPVTFARGANTTNSACSVTSSGVVSILAVGHCEIVLSAASDATYAAASDLTRNFEVVADQASSPFVTSVSADNQSVTLSFAAPSYIGGSPIRAYGINAYRNGSLVASYSGCASTDTSCTITGLTNGVAYTFRMVAINAAGDGVESASVGPVTPATHAEAVRHLTAVGVNTALDVSWLAPASLGGGTFDSYRIYVRVRGGSYPSVPTEVIYDGTQTLKQLTGLVNGTSYDVKVVTITTANAAQLVSNTAEVLQYPRTIPDAPQSVSLAPVSASNLLVSWTAPISDGGDAISAYTARIAGGPNCTVAATSNACEVAGLVPGTVYTIDVFATNSAGDSTSTVASITFRAATVAGANQNNQSSSNSAAGPANPTTGNRWEVGGQVHEDLWIALDKIATAALNGSVDGVTISGKLGGKATFKGKGLDAVRSAYIGNHIPVKILKATDTELTVALPGSKIDGWHDMWFFVDSHAIRYVDVVRYGVLQPNVVKWVKGFKVAPKKLTIAQKQQIKKAMKAVGKYKRVDCRGSYKAIHMTCKYIKTLRPAGYVHITKLKVKPTSKQAKVVKLTFTK